MYEDYLRSNAQERDPNHEVTSVVFWGDSGANKSRTAREFCQNNWKDVPIYTRKGQEKTWWSDYKGENIAILDEFDWREVPINVLKAWLDRGPCTISGKMQTASPLSVYFFIITCQDHPKDWYPFGELQDRDAIQRRLSKIYEFRNPVAATTEKELLDKWTKKSEKWIPE